MSNQMMSRRKLLASLGAATVAAASGGLLGSSRPANAQAAAEGVVSTTVSELRSMTSPPAASLYYVTDPGQAGLFYYDAYDTVSTDNTGTVLTSASGLRFRRWLDNDLIQASWFTAKGDGKSNDSPAIQAAVNSLQGRQTLVLEAGKSYLLKQTIMISGKNVRLNGAGATFISDGNDMFIVSDCENCRLEDLTFTSLNPPGSRVNYAFQTRQADHVEVENCQFHRLLVSCTNQSIHGNKTGRTSFTIRNCLFSGNYNGTGGETYTLCTNQNIGETTIEHNQFMVKNVLRLLQIEDCRQSVIQRNRIEMSSAGKNSNVLGVYGSWGLSRLIGMPAQAAEHLLAASILLDQNYIEVAAPHSETAPLIASGLNAVQIQHNELIKQNEPHGGKGIELNNCENIVIENNRCKFGSVHIFGNGERPPRKYKEQPTKVDIRNNTFSSFIISGAIWIASCKALERLAITNNHFNSVQEQMNVSEYYINLADCSIATLLIQGNSGYMRRKGMSPESAMNSIITGAASRISITKSHVLYKEQSGNSWQAGSTFWNPGLVARDRSVTTTFAMPGALMGDNVNVALPYDLQGCQLSAVVPYQGNITLTIYNHTGSDKNFYSAEWRVKLLQ